MTKHSMIIKLSINGTQTERKRRVDKESGKEKEWRSLCYRYVSASSFAMSPSSKSIASPKPWPPGPSHSPNASSIPGPGPWGQILVALFWQVSRELSTRSIQIKCMQTNPPGKIWREFKWWSTGRCAARCLNDEKLENSIEGEYHKRVCLDEA